MPGRDSYLMLARQIRAELNTSHLAFKSYGRRDITERLRQVSGEATTRIKQAGMAKEIERIFLEQGLRFYPKLSETQSMADVRVWRAGTLAAEILDLILEPGVTSDHELGNVTQKIKGQWDWNSPYPPTE